MSTEDGATPAAAADGTLSECMGRYKHHWQWMWETVAGQRVWTNRVECTTCGITEQRGPNEDQPGQTT